MDDSPLERVASRLEASAPDVLKAWLDHRPCLAHRYLSHVDLGNRSKEIVAEHWQEARPLFFPSPGIEESVVVEMQRRISQELLARSPDEREMRMALVRYVREDQTASPNLTGVCYRAILAWSECWLKNMLDSLAISAFQDQTIRCSLVQAHWFILRLEVDPWTSETAAAVMSKWNVATVVALAHALDPTPVMGIGTLRTIFGWDLKQARDTWYLHTQKTQTG